MKRSKTGQYETITMAGNEPCRAFVPNPLPPVPPLQIDVLLQEKMERALLALGGLNAIGTLLPDTSLFQYMFVRKESVLSSQIEGTQSSLSDLLQFEVDGAPGAPLDDVREVSNYVAAMEHGLKRMREGFPLSGRLIREMHEILLSKGRGSEKTPGEFRRSQNWIGGTRPGNAVFVPPPHDRIPECMGDLEKFLHDQPTKTPALIKAALAHVQFETIHPFLDGNGRIGRLLITLILCAENVLCDPTLYLSLYFKTWRRQYYWLLQRVRAEGDWEAWLEFFLEAITETAGESVCVAKKLVDIGRADKERIQTIGRAAATALRVHDVLLRRRPIASINFICGETGLSHHTAQAALIRLEALGIVREVSGRKRNMLFSYSRYVEILDEGTELERRTESAHSNILQK